MIQNNKKKIARLLRSELNSSLLNFKMFDVFKSF